MRRRIPAVLLATLALVAAGSTRAVAATPEAVLEAAIALACTDPPPDAPAMAAALGAALDDERSIVMGEETFGWHRRFALPAVGTLRVTRLAPWDTLRRIAPGLRPSLEFSSTSAPQENSSTPSGSFE